MAPSAWVWKLFTAFSDERRLDAVERLIPLAEQAGLSMSHLAMTFAISHPGVTSALLGARTMEQLDGPLDALSIELDGATLARLDELFPAVGNGGPGPEAWAW